MASARKGTVVDERYKLIRKVGTGGMADVWLADDTELDREVAIKILHDRFAQDSEFVERFQREGRSAAGLQHDGEESLDLLDRSQARPALLIGAWRNRGENSRMPAYCGIRNERWTYVRYAEGTEELYQIARDPAMLRNLASDPSSQPTLRRLRALTRDQCVPTPPGFAW